MNNGKGRCGSLERRQFRIRGLLLCAVDKHRAMVVCGCVMFDEDEKGVFNLEEML